MRIPPYFTLVALGIFPLACGDDDPGGRVRDPAAHDTGGASTAGSGADGGGAFEPLGPPDAGYDAASGYRDPNAGDGACTAPNLECASPDGGMACVDVANDVANCGKCGAACLGDGTTCIARTCACSAVGFAYCPQLGGCIDVTSDVNNCGQCGIVCDPGQFNACVGGSCTAQ